jgi:hypothetical protein
MKQINQQIIVNNNKRTSQNNDKQYDQQSNHYMNTINTNHNSNNLIKERIPHLWDSVAVDHISNITNSDSTSSRSYSHMYHKKINSKLNN